MQLGILLRHHTPLLAIAGLEGHLWVAQRKLRVLQEQAHIDTTDGGLCLLALKLDPEAVWQAPVQAPPSLQGARLCLSLRHMTSLLPVVHDFRPTCRLPTYMSNDQNYHISKRWLALKPGAWPSDDSMVASRQECPDQTGGSAKSKGNAYAPARQQGGRHAGVSTVAGDIHVNGVPNLCQPGGSRQGRHLLGRLHGHAHAPQALRRLGRAA